MLVNSARKQMAAVLAGDVPVHLGRKTEEKINSVLEALALAAYSEGYEDAIESGRVDAVREMREEMNYVPMTELVDA